MRAYQVLIILGNRQLAVMHGRFSSDCAAIDMAFAMYEEEGVWAAVPRRAVSL